MGFFFREFLLKENVNEVRYFMGVGGELEDVFETVLFGLVEKFCKKK